VIGSKLEGVLEGLGQHVLLAGTYEEFVIGYKIVGVKSEDEESSDKCSLIPDFTVRAHCGPVRSLCAGSKYAISGGTDEVCKIYDFTTKTEHGTLMHHEGTVSCLASQPPSHLLTASDDNSIAVVRMGSWQVEKTLYKHSAGVTALAMHPTGKICFSAGKDKKLITWNLVKARPAFITNIKGIAEFLTVSPDGTRYAVGVHRRVDVYSIENAGIEYTINMKARPNCLVFLDNETVVVGGEASSAQMHSLIEKNLLKTWEAHQTRIRCLLVVAPGVLASASSCDGAIKLWRCDTDRLSPVILVGSVETQCRITCLTAWHPGLRNESGKKKKRSNVGETNNITPTKKKIKIDEGKKETTIAETVTVTEEVTVKVKEKLKKSKKKKKVETVNIDKENNLNDK